MPGFTAHSRAVDALEALPDVQIAQEDAAYLVSILIAL